MPDRIEVGYSKSKQMKKIIKEMGIKRLLIVADYNLIQNGITDYLFDILDNEKINYQAFDEVKQEPIITEIGQVIKDLKVLLNYDEIFGIGEGKAIECLIGKKSNPISDLFYLNSIKLVMENLFSAVKNG